MNIDVIRTLTMKATTEGVTESAAALKGLATAHDSVAKSAITSATTTDTSAKRQLSLADAVDKAERRFNSSLRAQQDFQKVQQQMNAAVAQNPALQDRANAVIALAAERYGQAGLAAKAFSAATSGVSGQLIALSSGAGPAGTFLAALGPWGVAAAVGLGAAEKALSLMSDAAHGLAQKSQELRSFAEVTGLSTAQIQALRSEASKFGVTGDDVQSAIQQFTARFNDLRIGQGELLTQIRRVNPALAEQMAGVSNAGDALTLFGKALEDVDNIFQRNALVKAATGRGGLTSAAFLTGLDVSKVTDSYVAAGKALDDNLIKKLAQLDIDIAKTSAKANQNISSIFSQDVLEAELKWAKAFLSVSETMKTFSASSGWSTFVNGVFALANAVPLLGPLLNAGRGVSNLLPSSNTGPSFNDRFSPANESPLKPFTAKPEPTIDPRFAAETLNKQIGAMGDAASAADKLKLAQMQLAISGKDAGLSEAQLGAASRVLNENFSSTAISARIGMLGQMASTNDIVLQKQYAINKANRDGAGISREQQGAILSLTRAQADYARQSTQASLGVATFDVAAQAQKELAANIQAGIVPIDQQGEALVALTKKYRDLHDAAQVAGSKLPQLTQLGLDAGNLDKQLDTMATGSLNNFSDALLSIANHSSSVGDAFKNLGMQIITSLQRMIIQMTIIQPIAASLKQTLSGIGGGGFGLGSLFGGASAAGPASILQPGTGGMFVPTFHTGGMIGMDGGPSRYVHPSYFESAPRFHSGGIAGDEVPIVAKKGEGVFTPGQMAAMGGASGQTISIVHAPVYNLEGTAEEIERVKKMADEDRRNFDQRIAGLVGSPNSKTRKSIHTNTTAAPRRN